MYKTGFYIILGFLFVCQAAHAQRGSAVKLLLSDGTPVVLVQQRGIGAPEGTFNYLPVNLRIASANNMPEFSFLAYRPDSLSPISGGILHLLLVWGLDARQMSETESLLIQKTDSSAYLAGSVFMDQDKLHPTAEILPEGNELADLLRKSLKSAAKTPLHAGAKTAMSFHFDAEGAQMMEEALKNPKSFRGVQFRMYFTFNSNMFRGDLSPEYLLEGDFEKWLTELN